MKKNLINLAVAATLGLAAFAVSAEDMYRGAWYAVPGVTYMNTDGDLNASNGPGVFLKLGKELSESWDIQGGLGYNTASEDTGIAGASGRYKQTTLGLDALYMFSRSNFRPFVLAGLGVARNKVDYSFPGVAGDDSKTSWLGNVGIGAQYLINDSFGLQADLREQWSRAPIGRTAVGAANDNNTIANTLLNFGGIFRFGAPAPMPVIAETPVAAPEPAPMAAAEPAPMVAAEPVKCEPKVQTINISADTLFAFNKATLADTTQIDNEVVAKMKENEIFASVKITGHTDRLGSDAYNQKLSEKRANAVRDYIISKGIDGSRLIAVGKGETTPVVQCSNKGRKALIECLAPNRRVEIEATRTEQTGCN